jgi:hypothetical protein
MFRLQERVVLAGGVFADQSSERGENMIRLTLAMTQRESANQIY